MDKRDTSREDGGFLYLAEPASINLETTIYATSLIDIDY